MPHYLICYDICEPRRLSRLHRHLKKQAMALQYSVFLLKADSRTVDPLMDELATLIDEKRDDLRCYRLPARGFAARLGAAVLPPGIHLTSLPARLHLFREWKDDDAMEGRSRGIGDGERGESGRSEAPSVASAKRSPARRSPRRPRSLRRTGVYRL